MKIELQKNLIPRIKKTMKTYNFEFSSVETFVNFAVAVTMDEIPPSVKDISAEETEKWLKNATKAEIELTDWSKYDKEKPRQKIDPINEVRALVKKYKNSDSYLFMNHSRYFDVIRIIGDTASWQIGNYLTRKKVIHFYCKRVILCSTERSFVGIGKDKIEMYIE